MSKILAIVGISGQQGSSLAHHILATPALASQYKIRGITRDSSSSKAQSWGERGVEVVHGDLNDRSSLDSAFAGVHTVFGMTNSTLDQSKKAQEVLQGKQLADAAVAQGVQHLIWSTTPSAVDISSGQYSHIGHFDAKAEVESYIRSLPIRSTFYAPGAFMQNFFGPFRPQPDGSGGLAVMQFITPDTQIALIDIANDTGKYIGAILKHPENYYDAYVAAAGGIYTFQEVVDIMNKFSTKPVKFLRVPEEAWKSHLPEFISEEMSEMMKYFQDFGYYGKESEDLIRKGQEGIAGVTTLENFVERNAAAIGLK